MKKLNSIAELKAAVKEFKPVLDLRENHTDAIPDKRDILVCGGTGCTSSDSLQIIENLKEEIEKAIKKYGNNTQEMKQVAKALDIGIATLYRKVKKYNIKYVVVGSIIKTNGTGEVAPFVKDNSMHTQPIEQEKDIIDSLSKVCKVYTKSIHVLDNFK